jgi:hypothetical protein
VEYQNITLSLPKEVLRRVKHLAIEEGTSVSGLLARLLEDLVRRDESFSRARRHHLALLDKGLDLGTNGRIGWRREDLHERKTLAPAKTTKVLRLSIRLFDLISAFTCTFISSGYLQPCPAPVSPHSNYQLSV